ncbi:MAG TPA: hypothetical protein VFU31_17520, partial [Candidatus Binatia bacterium]|nr:hypothetical protein [Candidatus Binatia bacterium]
LAYTDTVPLGCALLQVYFSESPASSESHRQQAARENEKTYGTRGHGGQFGKPQLALFLAMSRLPIGL